MGKYANLDGSTPDKSLGDILRWQIGDRVAGRRPKTSRFETPHRENDGASVAATGAHVTWIGHASFAFRLGGKLIVAVNSDESVRRIKGEGRPLMPENERAEILAALESVDAVVIYNEPTPREIVSALLPDVLVKGGDWADNKIIGREEVEAAGGRVVSIPVLPGYSTTEILRKIRESAPSAETAKPAPPPATKSKS